MGGMTSLDGSRLRYPCPACGSVREDGRQLLSWHRIGSVYRRYDDVWCYAPTIGTATPCGSRTAALAHARGLSGQSKEDTQ